MKHKSFFYSILLLTFLAVPTLNSMFSDNDLTSSDEEEGIVLEDIIIPAKGMSHAIIDGNLDRVRNIINMYNECPEVLVSPGSQTPLHHAIIEGEKNIFNYLINETVFGTFEWINKRNAMLDRGLDDHPVEHPNETPLLTCVKKKPLTDEDFEMMSTLLVHGADINARDYQNSGTSLWNSAYRVPEHKESVGLRIAQLMVYSGADMNLPCKREHVLTHPNSSGRKCSPYERALTSGYSLVAQFLKNQHDLQLTLEQRFEQESDMSLQKNLYSRAIFYEDINVLRTIMRLIKKRDQKHLVDLLKSDSKKSLTIKDVKSDVVKKLIASFCLDRLNLVLSHGFYCKIDEGFRGRYLRNTLWNEGSQKTGELYTNLAKNMQTRFLKKFLNNGTYGDVLYICENDTVKDFSTEISNKKRKETENLLTIAKKTKQ